MPTLLAKLKAKNPIFLKNVSNKADHEEYNTSSLFVFTNTSNKRFINKEFLYNNHIDDLKEALLNTLIEIIPNEKESRAILRILEKTKEESKPDKSSTLHSLGIK